MKLKLGFSTCPNDTFIFEAMIHSRVDTEGFEFEPVVADVDELNRCAFAGDIDVTKLSYHAYAFVLDKYILLNAGSALGRNNGPLLVSKHKIYPDEVSDLKVAIPGEYTTANLLLNIAYPEVKEKAEYLFSDIEEAVLSEEADAGLIIHESRFTYVKKGLRKITDLGVYWEGLTGMPIPLGGIVARRELEAKVHQKVNRVLRRSVEYALKNPHAAYSFMREHAQEMDDEVMQSHIDLYVNGFTISLGREGKRAVYTLFEQAAEKGIIAPVTHDIFI